MKKTIRTLIMLLAVASTLVSCQKEDPALVTVNDGMLRGEFSVSQEKKVRSNHHSTSCAQDLRGIQATGTLADGQCCCGNS